MKQYDHTDPAVKELVESFRDHVLWLKSVRRTFKELFEDEKARPLIEKTAHYFFYDLNKILLEYLLLEFCKITDPATTRVKGEDVENFTVDNLISCVTWPEEVESNLNELADKIKPFRAKLKPARDNLLAHYGKKPFLKGEVLGAFNSGEDEKFLSELENICNITYEAVFGTICGDLYSGAEGDVEDLKETLKRALAFERLFSESKDDELAKLYCYLKEAGIL